MRQIQSKPSKIQMHQYMALTNLLEPFSPKVTNGKLSLMKTEMRGKHCIYDERFP